MFWAGVLFFVLSAACSFVSTSLSQVIYFILHPMIFTALHMFHHFPISSLLAVSHYDTLHHFACTCRQSTVHGMTKVHCMMSAHCMTLHCMTARCMTVHGMMTAHCMTFAFYDSTLYDSAFA